MAAASPPPHPTVDPVEIPDIATEPHPTTHPTPTGEAAGFGQTPGIEKEFKSIQELARPQPGGGEDPDSKKPE
jgi:hypothetical protein